MELRSTSSGDTEFDSLKSDSARIFPALYLKKDDDPSIPLCNAPTASNQKMNGNSFFLRRAALYLARKRR